MSEDAKRTLRSLRGLGAKIVEVKNIDVAKAKLSEQLDVVIANFGSSNDRFAYKLLDELHRIRVSTPLVVYSAEVNPMLNREAVCYGAEARATETGPLFSAVVRAIALEPQEKAAEAASAKAHCVGSRIAPSDSPFQQSEGLLPR